MRQVHVVLAPVGSDDAGDLVGQAGAEVVDLAVVDVEALVVARDQLEGEALAHPGLHVGAPRGLGGPVLVGEVAQGQGSVRGQLGHPRQDGVRGGAGTEVAGRDEVDLVGGTGLRDLDE